MPQFNTRSEIENGKNVYQNIYKESTSRFSATKHLLFMWTGSCFKLIWHHISIWIICYTIISVIYRNILSDPNLSHPMYKERFELLCIYAERFSGLLPITFITGFYVSQVVNRWWNQFMSLPWPDRLALKLVSNIPGTDPFSRNLRRTVMRYVNLSMVLVYRLVSRKVMERFPDFESLVEAKLMLPNEVKRLALTKEKIPHESTWVPLLWALKLLTKARNDGRIKVDAPIFGQLQAAFDDIEKSNRKVLNYGWVNFPLAYTQVATFSICLYFCAGLFGRQYLIPNEDILDSSTFRNLPNVTFVSGGVFQKHTPDFYIPFFTLFEIFCYYGWIKVAETLLNPFGDDDEDFQINYLIDRNLQVSYIIVDEANSEMELNVDPFLEAGIDIPKDLPYQPTPAVNRKGSIFGGSQQKIDAIPRAESVVSLAKTSATTMITKAGVPLGSFKKKTPPKVKEVQQSTIRRKRTVSSNFENLNYDETNLKIDIPEQQIHDSTYESMCSTAPCEGSGDKDNGIFMFPNSQNKAISTTTLAPLIPNEVKPEEENPDEVAQKLLSTEITEEDEKKPKQCLNMQDCIIEEDEEEDEVNESSKKDV